MPPCARWLQPFFATPACIFHSVSPPAWSSRRWRHGICLRMPAGCSRSSPRRRAFFILFPRRHGHLAAGGSEFCHLMPAGRSHSPSSRRAFFILFPAGMVVSPLPAWNLPPCARWLQPFFAPPACIFHPISPPVWSFRRWRRGICLLLPAGAAVLRHAGVHFLFCFPAGMAVSTVPAGN